jgi:hypothetical protein
MAFSQMESLACAQLQGSYTALMQLIDFLLSFYSRLLTALRNALKRIEVFVYNEIVKNINNLVNLAKRYEVLPKDISELKDDACQALLACEALFIGFTYTKYPSGNVTDPITGQPMTPYEFFKKYACGNGIDGLIDFSANTLKGFIDTAKAFVDENAINKMEQLINNSIQDYEDFLRKPIDDILGDVSSLFDNYFSTAFDVIFPWAEVGYGFKSQTANIFDLIDFMNAFAGCAFELCDLSTSVYNKINDIEKKCSVSAASRSYEPNQSEVTMLSNTQSLKDSITYINGVLI